MASFVVAALEGDFRDPLAEIARMCGRRPIGEVQLLTDWASVAAFTPQKNHLSSRSQTEFGNAVRETEFGNEKNESNEGGS